MKISYYTPVLTNVDVGTKSSKASLWYHQHKCMKQVLNQIHCYF